MRNSYFSQRQGLYPTQAIITLLLYYKTLIYPLFRTHNSKYYKNTDNNRSVLSESIGRVALAKTEIKVSGSNRFSGVHP